MLYQIHEGPEQSGPFAFGVSIGQGVARLLHICGTIFGTASRVKAPFGHLTADWSAETCPPVELPLLAVPRQYELADNAKISESAP